MAHLGYYVSLERQLLPVALYLSVRTLQHHLSPQNAAGSTIIHDTDEALNDVHERCVM